MDTNVFKVRAVQTLIVDDNGTPGVDCNYTVIQWAIDNASSGDSVYVKNGTYFENLIINKTINLKGEGREVTKIIGNGTGDVIKISSNWTSVSKLNINGSGDLWYDAGIKAEGIKNCNVIDNNISSNNGCGVLIYNSANIKIENNICNFNDQWGMWIDTVTDSVILNNSVSYNINNGIHLNHVSNYNIIENNTCNFNRKGHGINSESCHYNIINNNTCNSNGASGIVLWNSDSGNNNYITNNTLSSNLVWGIAIYRANYNIFYNNRIYDRSGIHVRYSSYNTFLNNNISSTDDILRHKYNLMGITLSYSSHNYFYNTSMYESNFYILGNKLEHWNTHKIPINNEVNNKPVYYWKNVAGGIIPYHAGEIILANCTNISISNQNLSNGTTGVILGFSNSNIIKNNLINSSTQDCIVVSYWSSNNTIKNNYISKSRNGILLNFYSNNNTFENNTINNTVNNQFTPAQGIYIFESKFQKVFNNTLIGIETAGILLEKSSNNYLTENKINKNGYNGIYLQDSNNNTVINNHLTDILGNHI
jgi:parallel beta-helix repeat protein